MSAGFACSVGPFHDEPEQPEACLNRGKEECQKADWNWCSNE